MNTEEFSSRVKKWLKDEGKNTQWLADKCGVKLSVVYSWFSTRGFPLEQRQFLEGEMSGYESTSLIRIPFTDEQLALTQKAARASGYENIQDYCQKAIEENVKQELYVEQFNKAAEDPTDYKP